MLGLFISIQQSCQRRMHVNLASALLPFGGALSQGDQVALDIFDPESQGFTDPASSVEADSKQSAITGRLEAIRE